MEPHDLRNWINCLSQDISFEYLGKLGLICPFKRSDISIGYDGKEASYSSIDDVMNSTFIGGKPLNLKEICTDINFE